MRDNFANRFVEIRLIYFAIDIIEKVRALQAQLIYGILQFLRAVLAESLRAGILLLGIKPAALPA